MKKVDIKYNLPVSILKEGNKYIAYTPTLDLSTYGKSEEQAKKRFEEVVNIFFEELIELGTIDKVLTNLGWQKIQAKWNPPIVISQEIQTVRMLA